MMCNGAVGVVVPTPTLPVADTKVLINEPFISNKPVERALLTLTLPFTIKLLFIEASLDTDNMPFNDMSSSIAKR